MFSGSFLTGDSAGVSNTNAMSLRLGGVGVGTGDFTVGSGEVGGFFLMGGSAGVSNTNNMSVGLGWREMY